jgi:hypothetical protein
VTTDRKMSVATLYQEGVWMVVGEEKLLESFPPSSSRSKKMWSNGMFPSTR